MKCGGGERRGCAADERRAAVRLWSGDGATCRSPSGEYDNAIPVSSLAAHSTGRGSREDARGGGRDERGGDRAPHPRPAGERPPRRARRGGHGARARTRAASFPLLLPRGERATIAGPRRRGLGRDDAVDVDDEEEDEESSSIAEPSPAEPGDASRDASPSSGASSSPASINPFASWSRRLQRVGRRRRPPRRPVPRRLRRRYRVRPRRRARPARGARRHRRGDGAGDREDGPLEARRDGSRAIPPRDPRSTAPRGSRRYFTT